jgi:hypothetical protein
MQQQHQDTAAAEHLLCYLATSLMQHRAAQQQQMEKVPQMTPKQQHRGQLSGRLLQQ